LPGAVRGGYQSFVLIYEGEDRGGVLREDFVKACVKRGVPLTVDRYSQINFTYGMLHKAPLFTEVDRRELGGVCFDPTRLWEEITRQADLPVCERRCRQLVSLPRLVGVTDAYVRACARAMLAVLSAGRSRASSSAVRPRRALAG